MIAQFCSQVKDRLDRTAENMPIELYKNPAIDRHMETQCKL